ncbi:MAG TPA: carotenoid biosynthesis protein [Mycobacteriales bacterium]|nr:carotenoid biosynthesis protein [Mycobacteriales bacterium]
MSRTTGLRGTWLLAGLTVLAQIGYPLTSGTARDRLTVATVALFFATSVTHALITRGARFTAALVGVTTGGGLLVEAIGVRTGIPFGDYAYADSLGAKVLGVPVVIPLAWTMMAYPALLVAHRVTTRPLLEAVLAGAALASWDLFLDPQMVAAGHWIWSASGPSITGIPVSNYLGWLVVATVMMGLLQQLVRDRDGGDVAVPYALYLWTYASSVLANLAFFGRPLVALVGGLGMGAVVAIFLRSTLHAPARARLATP